MTDSRWSRSASITVSEPAGGAADSWSPDTEAEYPKPTRQRAISS